MTLHRQTFDRIKFYRLKIHLSAPLWKVITRFVQKTREVFVASCSRGKITFVACGVLDDQNSHMQQHEVFCVNWCRDVRRAGSRQGSLVRRMSGNPDLDP